MKKVVAMMLSLVLALGLMAGCGQKDAGTAGGTKTIESLKIAFSPYADADQITTATEPLEALLKAKLLEKSFRMGQNMLYWIELTTSAKPCQQA